MSVGGERVGFVCGDAMMRLKLKLKLKLKFEWRSECSSSCSASVDEGERALLMVGQNGRFF